MYLLVKILGAFPYKVVGTRYRLSFWWSLTSAVVLIWVFVDCAVFLKFVYKRESAPDIRLYVIVTEKISAILAALVPVVINVFVADQVEAIYRCLSKVDVTMRSLGLEATDRTPYLLSVSMIVTILFSSLVEGDWTIGLNRMVAGIMTSFITMGTVFRIYHDVKLVTTRLGLLNEEMMRLKSTYDVNKLSKLQILCKCHEKISQISEMMADMYSHWILIIISCCVLHLINNGYGLVDVHPVPPIPSDPTAYICATCLAFLVDTGMLMLVVLPCTSATNQAHQFNVHLYQMMIDRDDSHIGLDHNLRLHLHGDRRLIFSAGGIFNVDMQVLHSVFSTLVNEVVLLYQFTKANRK